MHSEALVGFFFWVNLSYWKTVSPLVRLLLEAVRPGFIHCSLMHIILGLAWQGIKPSYNWVLICVKNNTFLTLAMLTQFRQMTPSNVFAMCPWKQSLTFHSIFLPLRQSEWNVKFCFHAEVRIASQSDNFFIKAYYYKGELFLLPSHNHVLTDVSRMPY